MTPNLLPGRLALRVVTAPDGHWLWTGALNKPNGYGVVGLDGKNHLVHRISYETFVGPIPDGQQIDHLCRIRRCLFPGHLEPVTPLENMARSPLTGIGSPECKRGHLLTGDNLRLRRNGTERVCRTCQAMHCRNSRARLKAQPAA